jgi:hypothetical protein
MNTLQRNELIDAIVSNSRRIPCVFLNPAGSPTKLHSDLSTIDLLVDKNGEEKFLDFCRSHDNVKEVVIYPRFRRKKVSIKMVDGSEVRLKLIRNMVLRALCTLPVDEILETCREDHHGMLVPTIEHQFEYNMMKGQFSYTEMPDKYQKYFSAMEPSVRSSIFKYLQTKYNFVFNTIEDLYRPKSSLLFKITVGLRALPENSISLLIIRGIQYALWNIGFLFSKKSRKLGPTFKKGGAAEQVPSAKSN